MAKGNRLFAAFVCICFTLHGASSFSLGKINAARTQQQQQATVSKNTIISQEPSSIISNEGETSNNNVSLDNKSTSSDDDGSLQKALFAGCITFLTTTPLSAFAAELDELELTELPPVYVPILFAIAIIGGVGVLTASLGNVMDEGT